MRPKEKQVPVQKMDRGLYRHTDSSGAWEPHEKDDMDFGRPIKALMNPEIISATSVDMLQKEKQLVVAAEKADDRVRKLLKFISDKQNTEGDSLVNYRPQNYPEPSSGGGFCCC